jgi:hypothetical protein
MKDECNASYSHEIRLYKELFEKIENIEIAQEGSEVSKRVLLRLCNTTFKEKNDDFINSSPRYNYKETERVNDLYRASFVVADY